MANFCKGALMYIRGTHSRLGPHQQSTRYRYLCYVFGWSGQQHEFVGRCQFMWERALRLDCIHGPTPPCNHSTPSYVQLGIFTDIGPTMGGQTWYWLPDISNTSNMTEPMIGENRQLVTNELVEFEKWPVEVQDCRKITDHSRGIHRIYPNLIKENRRMSTCNRSDLQTLGSQPLMPQYLPNHWIEPSICCVTSCHFHVKQISCKNQVFHEHRCMWLVNMQIWFYMGEMYSLRFISKVTFGHNLHYETKDTFGKISFKLRQTNWNVAINNVNVVADELPSQSTNNLHLFNNWYLNST